MEIFMTKRSNFVRRPWINYWESIRYDTKNLDQQCKLIRNQVASMDLGIPGFKLYDSYFEHDERMRPRHRPTGREAYLEWVADWKNTYAELSQCIRDLKAQRKLKGFLAVRDKIERFAGSNASNHDQLSQNTYSRVNPTLDTLRISAQVMLNARAIGKLASAQLRQRAYEKRLSTSEEDSKMAA
jgi:hypothetical protein